MKSKKIIYIDNTYKLVLLLVLVIQTHIVGYYFDRITISKIENKKILTT